MSEVKWSPHSDKQDAVMRAGLEAAKPIILLSCGIQFGKTTVGAWLMRLYMQTFMDPLDTFIIAAPNYKILRQSTLPAFASIMDGYGTYERQDALFKMRGGGTCYFRTATQPDSVVGITNCRFIWLDEGGKVSLYFWENLQARASFKKAPIIITTSPYAINWVYRDLIKPYQRGLRKDMHFTTARSNENPYFPKEEYEAKKATMHPKRFNALYGGQFEKMEGLVYDCFDEDIHLVNPFKLPEGTKYYASIDWGYTHPCAFLVMAITPEKERYIVYEYYKAGKTIDDIIEVALEKKKEFKIETVYADPAQPGYLESFNRAGLPCIAANNDVRAGVDLVYKLFKTNNLKIFKGYAPHLVDELSAYHWPELEDVNPNRDLKDRNPVKQDDDACDSLRYLSISTIFDNAEPIVPAFPGKKKKPISHDMAELLKSLDDKQHTEAWS